MNAGSRAIVCHVGSMHRSQQNWSRSMGACARAVASSIAMLACSHVGVANAATISLIGGADHFAGQRVYQYPTNTRLGGAAVPPELVEIVEYSGDWADGFAEGNGLLVGKLIRKGSDTPEFRNRNSTDLAKRGMADAIAERMVVATTGAVPASGVQTLQPIPDDVTDLRWAGLFKHGMPVGPGTLTWCKGTLPVCHSLVTTLEQWRPSGSSTAFIGDRKVASFNLQWKDDTLSLADGAFSLFLYTQNSRVAAVYAGAVNGGAITGSWVDLPYSFAVGNALISSFQNHVVMYDGQGVTFDCTYPKLPGKRPVAEYLFFPSDAYSSSIDAFLNQGSDIVGNNGKARCSAHSAGYTYTLTIESNGVFGRSITSVDSCRPPENGYTGTVVKYKDGFGCTYERWEDSSFSKFIDKLVDTVVFKPAHVVADPFLKAMEAAGKPVTSSICQAFGYQEGKNCSFDTNGAITVATFPTGTVRTDATLTPPAKRIAENVAAVRSADPERGTGSLGALGAFLDKCVYACPDALMPFAQASSEDLIRAMKPGLDQDARNNKIAGVWGSVASLVSVVGTGMTSYEIFQAWQPYSHTNRAYEDAQAWLDTLKTNKGKYPNLAFAQLYIDESKWIIAPTLLSATSQTADQLQSEMNSFVIGKTLSKNEFWQLVYFVHGDYKSAKAILQTNRDLTTSDAFWKAFFASVYTKYQLPQPPATAE